MIRAGSTFTDPTSITSAPGRSKGAICAQSAPSAATGTASTTMSQAQTRARSVSVTPSGASAKGALSVA